MKQEVRDLNKTIDKLRKENETLNGTVDIKIGENCSLETEQPTWMNSKQRLFKTCRSAV